jgi:hypothetical protein
MVAGDKNVTIIAGRPDARIQLFTVSEQELGLTQEAFADCSNAARVFDAVQRSTVTLVRGPRGSGRSTLALRALTRIDPVPTGIYRLTFSALRDLSTAQVQGGSALLGLPSNEQLMTIPNRAELDSLADDLAQNGSRLVLTVDSAVPLPDYGARVSVVDVDHPGRAAPQQVLELRVRHLVSSGDRARVEDLLVRPELGELVSRYLDSECTFEDAVALATCILSCPAAEAMPAQWVDTKMAGRQADKYAHWFNRLPDLQTRCMAISLAVFGGLTHEFVSEASDLLLRTLDPRAADRERREAPELFLNPRQQEFTVLNATTEIIRQELTDQGAITLETVRYRSEGFGGKLFMYVWEQYRQVRAPLVEWLAALADYSSQEVRRQVAVAVGKLAVQNFPFVRRSMLTPWAASVSDDGDGFWLHEVAATALVGAAERNRQLREFVRSTARSWEQSGQIEQEVTAARVYGLAYGPSDANDVERIFTADEILRVLTRLAREDSWAVRLAVSAAMRQLLLDAPQEFTGRILTLLHQWANSTAKKSRPFAGKVIFLLLALESHESSGLNLFKIAADSAVHRGQIVWLWWSVLNSPDLSDAARAVLSDWAEKAQFSDAVFTDMCAVLKDVAHDQRTTDIMKKLAKGWADEDGIAPRLGEWIKETWS